MSYKSGSMLILLLTIFLSSVSPAAEMKTSQIYDAPYDRTWDALIWTAGITRAVNISKQDKEGGKLSLMNKAGINGAGFATIEMLIKEIDEGKTAIMFVTEGTTWARNINRGWTGGFLNDVEQRLKKK